MADARWLFIFCHSIFCQIGDRTKNLKDKKIAPCIMTQLPARSSSVTKQSSTGDLNGEGKEDACFGAGREDDVGSDTH